MIMIVVTITIIVIIGTMMSKPGGKLPEAYKREVHKLTSKALTKYNNQCTHLYTCT